MAINLLIIIASTRPGRNGKAVADWIIPKAEADSRFKVEVADLADINLPFLDEVEEPDQQKYTKQHTKDWSKTVSQADALIFVTPEYNHSAPASLINALSFLYHEWHYKPVAFVSYGGISGGTRSVQHIKPVVNALKMVPSPEAVNINFIKKHLGEDGAFKPEAGHDRSAQSMLNELARWPAALKVLRKS